MIEYRGRQREGESDRVQRERGGERDRERQREGEREEEIRRKTNL